MIVGGAAFLAGAALGGGALNVYMLILGRVLLGIGVGFANQMQESPDPSRDIENGTNASNSIPMPVLSFASGEGLPYAPPNDWPDSGDRWVWKTGKRKGHRGYWKDRFLQPPMRLNGAGFRSKKSLTEFIERVLPDTNVDTFFSLFHWRIPCIEQSQSKANHKQGRKRGRPGSSSKAEGDFADPNGPEDDSGDSEMSTGQDTSSNISTPVQTPTSVDLVAGHAFPTSQENLLSMEIEFPEVIRQFLTSALKKLTNELDSTQLESLGDRMGYFNHHLAWELEAGLSKIDQEVLEFEQKISELQQTAKKLRYENQSLFSETRRHNRNSSRPGSSSQGNSQPDLAIIGVEFSGSLPRSQELVELPIIIHLTIL